ncbi:MAG: hypothetical protein ACRCXT_04370 [Paraclostridium sp.]
MLKLYEINERLEQNGTMTLFGRIIPTYNTKTVFKGTNVDFDNLYNTDVDNWKSIFNGDNFYLIER